MPRMRAALACTQPACSSAVMTRSFSERFGSSISASGFGLETGLRGSGGVLLCACGARRSRTLVKGIRLGQPKGVNLSSMVGPCSFRPIFPILPISNRKLLMMRFLFLITSALAIPFSQARIPQG